MAEYVDTTIRIGAETGMAEAALGRVQRGFDVMQAQSMPGLQRAFGATSIYALRFTGVLSEMGLGSQALTGPFGAVARGLGAIHPAFLAVAVAGGLVTGMLMRQKTAAAQAIEGIEKYHGAIQKLANEYTQMGENAREQARLDNQLVAAKMKLVEEEMRLAKLGYVQASQWDKFLGTIIEFDKTFSTLPGAFKRVAIGTEEQISRNRELFETYENLKNSLVTFGEGSATFTTTVTGHRQKEAEATKVARDQLNELALEYQRFPAVIQAAVDTYDDAGERLIYGGMTEAEWTAAAENAATKRIALEKNTQDKAYALTRRYSGLVEAGLQRHLKLQQAVSAALIGLVTEEIAQRLEKKSKEWVIDAMAAGAAALMGKPGAAAAALQYAAAAAAAGAGAAVVRHMGAEPIYGGGTEGSGAGRTGEGTVSIERQRPVVSQGPITLNYSAIMTVQGNIYDTSDLRTLWNQWNLDQLRVAGVDAARQAKG